MITHLSEKGTFTVGCNYWASHAGIRMWSQWDENTVRNDLKKIAGAGLQLIRVFPLWPDFQPLTILRAGAGWQVELRMGEELLPDTPAGRAGVSEEMMTRLIKLLDIASENDLQVSIGLVTGWMSGRLFVPPAFEGRSAITDPLVIKWSVKMVRYIVRTLKDHPALVAWGPGNECNCLGTAETREQAWLWMHSIVSAIRSEDPIHPVISGMHSLLPGGHARLDGPTWTIEDQGELSDLMTVHPYQLFTPHAAHDPANQLRNAFHATAEARMYADIGGKPCLCEEFGNLGHMMASETLSAAYTRNTLFNLWLHDCRALFWWCAFDQVELEYAPYDWCALERELGMFRIDGTPRPILQEMAKFRQTVENMPFGTLPDRHLDGVLLAGRGSDAWTNCWSSFILAKQANADLRFAQYTAPLPDAPLYVLPSVTEPGITRTEWFRLLEKVQNGAVLYLSLNDVLLWPFCSVCGIEITNREERTAPAVIRFNGKEFTIPAPYRYRMELRGAEVLASDEEGVPVYLKNRYGKGTIYLLTVPMERFLTETPGSFHGKRAMPCYEFYREFLQDPALPRRIAAGGNPAVTFTEHRMDENNAVIAAINNAPEAAECPLMLQAGWVITGTHYGNEAQADKLMLNGNDAVIFSVQKKA